MKKITNNLFRKKTDSLHLQFFRYLFVGGISFILDFSIYFALVHFFSVNYLISAATAFIISVMVNYLMSTEWVFNQSKIQNKALEFNLFMIISIVGLVFTEILLYLFTDIGGTNYLISKIIVAIIVLFWNFTARRIMFYGKKT